MKKSYSIPMTKVMTLNVRNDTCWRPTPISGDPGSTDIPGDSHEDDVSIIEIK